MCGSEAGNSGPEYSDAPSTLGACCFERCHAVQCRRVILSPWNRSYHHAPSFLPFVRHFGSPFLPSSDTNFRPSLLCSFLAFASDTRSWAYPNVNTSPFARAWLPCSRVEAVLSLCSSRPCLKKLSPQAQGYSSRWLPEHRSNQFHKFSYSV